MIFDLFSLPSNQKNSKTKSRYSFFTTRINSLSELCDGSYGEIDNISVVATKKDTIKNKILFFLKFSLNLANAISRHKIIKNIISGIAV